MGRLQQRSWSAEDGSARSVVEVVAGELGPSLTGAPHWCTSLVHLRWTTATPVRVTQSGGE